MTEWQAYAEAVRNGEIQACKRIKQAVERYFADLANPDYWFDEITVKQFIAFSRLCPHVKGHLRGQPIELSDWQQFLFANLFGFKHKVTGLRKYRSAYIQVARKNAKSTVAAVLANWFLMPNLGRVPSLALRAKALMPELKCDLKKQGLNGWHWNMPS